jgi:putative alpha-1,2-mannosidase
VLGAPFFDRAEIQFPDGRKISVEAQRSKPGAFLSRVTLDGAEVREPFVLHSALAKGARLVFSEG